MHSYANYPPVWPDCPCFCLLLRDHVHPYSQRDSNVETSVFFRHDAEALSATAVGDDEAEAAAKFARDDDQLAAVPAQPMYRSCIVAILPNNAPGRMVC